MRRKATWGRKRGKYRNVKTVVDGIVFDSIGEAERYKELKLLERAGEISDLRLQVPYSIDVNGHHICVYKSDFDYVQDGEEITEDHKGGKSATCITPVYRLKKKLMKAVHGIEIQEHYPPPKARRRKK